MRIPSSVFAVGRYAVGLLLIAGSLVLFSAPKKTQFTVHDKAYYADAATVTFVRPGFNISIVSAKIATDGTISVQYKLSDPKGLPLDRNGIETPGTISVSFVAAFIPKGQTQYVAYNTRTAVGLLNGKSGVQATSDSGGTTQTVATGEYVYTFAKKAVPPTGTYDATATHRIAIYGSRNLTEFDMGTDRDSEVFDFVPAGGTPAPREVIKTASCNKCHDQLAAHGGTRRGMENCITCHTSQTTDPDTGNTVDMRVMIHKIHQGEGLPSVESGTPYQIIGNANSTHDYSTVVMPSDTRRCAFCHEPGAKQSDAWMKNPSIEACGSCHDNVDFTTGKNHANLIQTDSSKCAQCHTPQGDKDHDLSIKGAHIFPQEAAANPGLVLKVTKVTDGVAGKAPTVTFTMKDFKGNPLTPADLPGGRLSMVLAGPTSDYGYTAFAGVTTPGYVSESALTAAKCGTDGTCTYTFTKIIPANAKGSFSIGAEGRRVFTDPTISTGSQSVTYGADNSVLSFSVDGSTVEQRRKIVDIAKCNNCHGRLTLHGSNRTQIEQCVLCHNPSQTDSGQRVNATVAADKAAPAQSVNMALMIHKIHTGEELGAAGLTYTVVGNGGSHNEFNEVRYPAMTPSGGVPDTAKCYMCHVNNTEAALPVGKNNVVDPQGMLNPAPATTSACTACHFSKTAMSHAVANTDGKFGESCEVCHGVGAAYDVLKEHAGK
jgi:OmcA/MtrC family decaheme c-type cytochrome